MEFLNIIEEKVNSCIWWIIRQITRLIPNSAKHFSFKISLFFKHLKKKIILFPWIVKRFAIQKRDIFKSDIANIDFKSKLTNFENEFKSISKIKFLSKIFVLFTGVNYFIKRPFRDLSPETGIMLICFSIGSLISGFAITSQIKQIYSEQTKHTRVPASVEVIEYERPEYYKTKLKQVEIYGLRIPVYYPEVNELKTVMIDFNIELDNKIGRAFIERREFPLRDHLVLNLEQVLAKYTLDEEGKAIIKEKLAAEVQHFLDNNNIDSTVRDVTITYLLAN